MTHWTFSADGNFHLNLNNTDDKNIEWTPMQSHYSTLNETTYDPENFALTKHRKGKEKVVPYHLV